VRGAFFADGCDVASVNEGDCICHDFSGDMVLWTVRETIKFTQNAVSEPESNTHGPEDRVTTNFFECKCDCPGSFVIDSSFEFRHSNFRGTLTLMLAWFKNLFADSEPQRDALGERGENVAARYLRNKGYKIIIRNYRCEMGEIDIVARDGKSLVFVEVKTRAYDDPAPEEQVNLAKQQAITRVAKLYLSRYGTPQPPARFDVVAIVWPNGQNPIIRHVESAFDATS
jgi:putative endonuclease